MKIVIFATGFLALTEPVLASEREEAAMKGHVSFLTSDAMRGREAA